MKVMCLTDEEISDVLQVISGVLQLGNVHFMAAGGAQIAEKSGMLMLQLIFVMAAGGAQIAEKSGMLMLQLIVYCS